MPFVKVSGGTQIHYQVPSCPNRVHPTLDPSKPVVLLLHPRFFDLHFFAPQYRDARLAKGYNLLAVDHHYHGETKCSMDSKPYDFWKIAKDILQLLDSLKVKKAYIFGNSLGGPIAVRMHMLQPEKVAALILCAKHPPVETAENLEQYKFLRDACYEPADDGSDRLPSDVVHALMYIYFGEDPTAHRDGGPRHRPEFSNSEVIQTAETGTCSVEYSTVRRLNESSALRDNSTLEETLVENYGTMANVDQTEGNRLGVSFGERTWTLSSAVSGSSGYGETYRSRFGFRHRFSTASLVAAARRRAGVDGDLGDVYVGNEPEGREPHLAERIIMANELKVTSIGDLWVASALTMDAEDDDLGEFDDQNSHYGDSPAIASNTARAAPIAEHRARSASATRRVASPGNGNALPGDNQSYSLSLSANNSVSRLQVNSYPTILQNTGLCSPSPAFDTLDTIGIASGNMANVDVLQPIIEGKPVDEPQYSESATPSLFSQLPLVVIFQYGLLALHSTVYDQVFTSYVVSKYTQGGLGLSAGDFAQLIAMMCLTQIFYQFYLYPTMGISPPLGRFSHLSMFRIGGLLSMFSYVSTILVRPFAEPGTSGGAAMADVLRLTYKCDTLLWNNFFIHSGYCASQLHVHPANDRAHKWPCTVSGITCAIHRADFGWLCKLLI
ncbi:unnamed protein product [Rhizoctonia solani]|uniref:AB hydrolase-1 domain-containing protein n=1 Tax=Rhizoctonia solani TaxID=456999 RepID=A0A8H3I2K3_9AGAM|nr:unnamed protein product [Rhizoctonia solani]